MASLASAKQRSAEESLEEFHRRMRNTVALMKSTDAYFFHKRVTKSMATQVVQGPFAYSLEFPIKFLKEHAKKFGLDVTFVTKDSERTWPIKITVRTMLSKTRVFAYGEGGWKTFLQENRIKVGDFLIFTLLRFSHFQVEIERAPVEVHPNDEGEDNGNNNENPSPRRSADHAPHFPRFSVTIRPSSHPRHNLCLAVPESFWDLHRNKLRSNDLFLRGPNEVWHKVKAKKTYLVKEEKRSVCLETGWEAFVVSNQLRNGDTLEFSLTRNSFFRVDLLERIDQH